MQWIWNGKPTKLEDLKDGQLQSIIKTLKVYPNGEFKHKEEEWFGHTDEEWNQAIKQEILKRKEKFPKLGLNRYLQEKSQKKYTEANIISNRFLNLFKHFKT